MVISVHDTGFEFEAHLSTYCISMLKPLILPQNVLSIIFLRESVAEEIIFLNLCFRESNRITQNNNILSTYHLSLFLLKKMLYVFAFFFFFGKARICNAIPKRTSTLFKLNYRNFTRKCNQIIPYDTHLELAKC